MPRAGKIEEVSLNDEVDKERGNKAFLFALTFDGKHVEVTSVQDGTTKHDKENMVVMYIMMKGSDGLRSMKTWKSSLLNLRKLLRVLFTSVPAMDLSQPYVRPPYPF